MLREKKRMSEEGRNWFALEMEFQTYGKRGVNKKTPVHEFKE